MASAKTRARLQLGLAVLLALAFLASGASKLANAKDATGTSFAQHFVAWGYPAWARFPVGAAEVLGALGLLVVATRPYAAAGLTLVMVGAVATHLRLAEWGNVATPLALGLLTAALAWTSWRGRPDRAAFKPVPTPTE